MTILRRNDKLPSAFPGPTKVLDNTDKELTMNPNKTNDITVVISNRRWTPQMDEIVP